MFRVSSVWSFCGDCDWIIPLAMKYHDRFLNWYQETYTQSPNFDQIYHGGFLDWYRETHNRFILWSHESRARTPDHWEAPPNLAVDKAVVRGLFKRSGLDRSWDIDPEKLTLLMASPSHEVAVERHNKVNEYLSHGAFTGALVANFLGRKESSSMPLSQAIRVGISSEITPQVPRFPGKDKFSVFECPKLSPASVSKEQGQTAAECTDDSFEYTEIETHSTSRGFTETGPSSTSVRLENLERVAQTGVTGAKIIFHVNLKGLDIPIEDDIGSFLTVTGYPEGTSPQKAPKQPQAAYAATAADYVTWRWGKMGMKIMTWLREVLIKAQWDSSDTCEWGQEVIFGL